MGGRTAAGLAVLAGLVGLGAGTLLGGLPVPSAQHVAPVLGSVEPNPAGVVEYAFLVDFLSLGGTAGPWELDVGAISHVGGARLADPVMLPEAGTARVWTLGWDLGQVRFGPDVMASLDYHVAVNGFQALEQVTFYATGDLAAFMVPGYVVNGTLGAEETRSVAVAVPGSGEVAFASVPSGYVMRWDAGAAAWVPARPALLEMG